MLAIRKDEVFLTITFLCSESSRESPHQVGPGAKPSLQDLFSLVLQKRTSVRRTERQGEGNSKEKQRTLKQHIQRAPSGQWQSFKFVMEKNESMETQSSMA